MIYAIYQSETLYLFEHIKSIDFMGINCIQGTALKAGKEDWREGLVFNIPVNTISRIIEYSDLDAFHRVVSNHYSTKPT